MKFRNRLATTLIASLLYGSLALNPAQAISVLYPFQGGTGTSTTPTDAQLLVGTGDGIYIPLTLTAGSNITISTSTSQLTITASGGGGSSLFSTSSTFTYLTDTSSDIVFGQNSTSGAPFFFDVSGQDLYVGDDIHSSGTVFAAIAQSNAGDAAIDLNAGEIFLRDDGSYGTYFYLTDDYSELLAADIQLIGPTTVSGALNLADGNNFNFNGSTTISEHPTLAFIDFQTSNASYTLARIKAPQSTNGDDTNEATISLLIDKDGDNSGVNEEFIDFYNEDYSDSHRGGIRTFKTGTGTLKPFVIGHYSGSGLKDAGDNLIIWPYDQAFFQNSLTVGADVDVATTTYSRYGVATTGHSLATSSDLLVSGLLEVDDQAYFDATSTFAGNVDIAGDITSSSIDLANNTLTGMELDFKITGNENTTSATYDSIGFTRMPFDVTKFSGYSSIKFKVIIDQESAGTSTTFIHLIDNDGTAVTSTELSVVDQSQFDQQIRLSPDISSYLAATDTMYRIQAKVTGGGTVGINWAGIVVNY